MKKHTRKALQTAIALSSMLLWRVATAQDPQVSQFYSNPLYLNPAFAGMLNTYCPDKPASRLRMVVNYRQQWKYFNTTFGSLDYLMPLKRPNRHLGVGMRFYNDWFGGVNTLQFAGNASYMMPLNAYWRVSFGLEASYSSRQLTTGAARWPDQFNTFGYQATPTPDALAANGTTMYPDLGAGLMAYNALNWVGLSLRNVLQPNQALLMGNSRLPIRYSLHGGRRFYLDNQLKRFFIITGQYKFQRQFDQLDIGGYIGQKPFVVGLWYRGLPVIKRSAEATALNHDALVVMAGFFHKNFNLAYSYDITISKIGPWAGGAHEISLRIRFVNPKCRQQAAKMALPCPAHLSQKQRLRKNEKQNLPFPFPSM